MGPIWSNSAIVALRTVTENTLETEALREKPGPPMQPVELFEEPK
jgi:hypothetical protein